MHALLVLLAFSIISALSAPAPNSDDDMLAQILDSVDGLTGLRHDPKPPKTGLVCLDPGLLRIIPMINGRCPGPAHVAPLHATTILRRTQTRTVPGGKTGLVDDVPEAKTPSILFSASSNFPKAPGPVIIPHFTGLPLLRPSLRPTTVTAPAPLSTPAIISTATLAVPNIAAASNDTIIPPVIQDSVVVEPNTTTLVSHVNPLVPPSPTSRTTTPLPQTGPFRLL